MFASFPKLVADSFSNVMQVTSFSYVKRLHLLLVILSSYSGWSLELH